MAQIRPKILLRYGRINLPIRVPMIDQTVDALNTFLTADTASASTTLTVKNITGFAINKILLIGEAGNQGSEIIKTSTSVAPTGSTVTLASATVFPHSSSTIVRIIPFDQVEISNASTVGGTKTVLTTASLVANSEATEYNDTVSTGGYYFARYKNSITSAFSPYSDAAPYGGYTIYSARSVIDKSLGELNKKTSEVLSDEFAFQQIDNFQEEVLREQKRWSFMMSFDSSLGQALTGNWRIAVPTDIDDNYTNKSIWNFRIGKQPDMIFVDKSKWDEIVSFVANTTLAVSISVSDTTVTLTNSSDFDDGGTISIGANQYAFTANNRTTNVLTLSTASTTTNTAGADVFQGASLGDPTYWTIWSGYIYHYPLVGASYNQRNYYLDYYKAQTQITKDSDLLIIPDSTAGQYYLQWKFLKKLNNGEETQSSLAARDSYVDRRERLKIKNPLGRTFRLKPRINSLNENNISDDDERIRLGNFPNI